MKVCMDCGKLNNGDNQCVCGNILDTRFVEAGVPVKKMVETAENTVIKEVVKDIKSNGKVRHEHKFGR